VQRQHHSVVHGLAGCVSEVFPVASHSGSAVGRCAVLYYQIWPVAVGCRVVWSRA
jgi:hypothetical protein